MSQGTSFNPANPNITYSVDGIRVSANDFMNFAGMALQDPLTLMEWFARTNAVKKRGLADDSYQVILHVGSAKSTGEQVCGTAPNVFGRSFA